MTSKYDAKLNDLKLPAGSGSEISERVRAAALSVLDILDPDTLEFPMQMLTLSGVAAVLLAYAHAEHDLPVADLLVATQVGMSDFLAQDQKANAQETCVAFLDLVVKLKAVEEPPAV